MVSHRECTKEIIKTQGTGPIFLSLLDTFTHIDPPDIGDTWSVKL